MIHSWVENWPISKASADFLKQHKMFSSENDFSHGRSFENPSVQTSLLFKAWSLDPYLDEWCQRIRVWWHEDKGIPVSVLVHFEFKETAKSDWGWPMNYNGHWCAYTIPMRRRQGYMKSLIDHAMQPGEDFAGLDPKDHRISAEGGLKNYLDSFCRFRVCAFWSASPAKTSWQSIHWRSQ